jgi:hypothetical protein
MVAMGTSPKVLLGLMLPGTFTALLAKGVTTIKEWSSRLPRDKTIPNFIGAASNFSALRFCI